MIKANPDYLTVITREALDLSDSERINRIKMKPWVGYTRATQIMKELEELLEHPKVERMPCMLIVSQSNNGKSMLAKKFIERHPAYDNPDGEGIIVPAIRVQAPPSADPSELYNSILSALFAPFKPGDSTVKKQPQVVSLLTKLNVRMLIVDEIHDILKGLRPKQELFLGEIKRLTNEVRLPIVGVGTKQALRAIRADEQLWNRFEINALPLWVHDIEFNRLLKTFESVIPLRRPSKLYDGKISKELHRLSEGTIGELARVLRMAAIYAIKEKVERIDLDVIKALEYLPPSERKKMAEGVV